MGNPVEFSKRAAEGHLYGVGNNIQLTDANGVPIGTSTNPLIQAAKQPNTQRPTITVSITPDYTAGDVIDTIKTLANVVTAAGLSVKLVSVAVRDKAGQAPPLILYFFRATPAAGTYTDNTALVWGAGDAANLCGVVAVPTANYKTVAGVSAVTIGDIHQVHTPDATSLFLLIVADGAYNAASTSDLILDIVYERY